MTDNEIIKALECCVDGECGECCFDEQTACKEYLLHAALDLIERQQAEIEKFESRQKPTAASGYKIENGKVVFFTNMLGGCRNEYTDLNEVVKTLNELLHEAYSKDEIVFHLKCVCEDLETAEAEIEKLHAYKLHCGNLRMEIAREFADRLKDKKVYSVERHENIVPVAVIDWTVKEMEREDE